VGSPPDSSHLQNFQPGILTADNSVARQKALHLDAQKVAADSYVLSPATQFRERAGGKDKMLETQSLAPLKTCC